MSLKNNNFCIVPFANIILEPNGSIGVCRIKGTEFTVGNIGNMTILEAFNSQKIVEWRKEFLNEMPVNCEKEIKHQKCNSCGELGLIQENMPTPSEIMERPYRLTPNLNGKCNLQCQMCHVWKFPNGLYDKTTFWEDATANIFPYLKEVDLLSGEPFIQKDTYKLIDIISDLNSDVLWSFTTNAHWKLTERIKSYLNRIDIKHIMLSIDSLDPETYYKIRYPGKLHRVLENLEKLLEYDKQRISNGQTSLSFKWNFLVQQDNWREVPNFYKFIKGKRIESYISFLYEPSKYSLLKYNRYQLETILNYWISELSWINLCRSMRIINPLLDRLDPLSKALMLDKLKGKKENEG